MRALVQRVSEASVTIDGQVHSSIAKGLLILLGIKQGDTSDGALFLADKCSSLRVFEDSEGKMNLALKDVEGSALIVSQFTLYGNAQKGNRPSFTDAASPGEAFPLYESFVQRMKSTLGGHKVTTGVFGTMMQVKIINEGPVTLIIENRQDK